MDEQQRQHQHQQEITMDPSKLHRANIRQRTPETDFFFESESSYVELVCQLYTALRLKYLRCLPCFPR